MNYTIFSRATFLQLLFLICLIPMLAFNSLHKYYVSVTQIEYVEEQHSIQIISRIFIDDLEAVMRSRYDESLTLAIKDEPQKVDYYIEKYIKEKLVFHIDGKQQELNYLGKEYEDDIVYIYLEILNVSEINTVEISNKVLFDLQDEQQNIVRTKFKGKNKSFVLLKENAKAVLNFSK
ncbi:MAG: peptidase E [Bacteroidia bacterium]|nr:peptidase E [Bacteroidia bacterium]MBT8279516.1 peptidase E [Bacteroidia bacterium]NND26061.1 peptidase E [Flavobacteriaceae bacterium]NNK61007.1 peptidase E [Flavobacteriaceae bacterium]NNL33599.1 peptidase E [Flavobacteriaceae bacterium]